MKLTPAQRTHLQRIVDAGGSVAVVSGGPLAWGGKAWSRTTLNKLAEMGLIEWTPGKCGTPPMATITAAGREALQASEPTPR